MRTKMKLPNENRDLRALVRRRRGIKATAYLFWLAALLLGLLRYQATHARHPMAFWQLALWLGGGAAIGFLLLRMWVFFTDRFVIGTVTRSGLSHGVKGDEFKLNTAIRVTDERGRHHRLRFEQKHQFYLLYREGVRICKFPFLTYPLTDPTTVDWLGKTTDACPQGGFCVVCGRSNGAGERRCAACGHSLIDPTLVFGRDR